MRSLRLTTSKQFSLGIELMQVSIVPATTNQTPERCKISYMTLSSPQKKSQQTNNKSCVNWELQRRVTVFTVTPYPPPPRPTPPTCPSAVQKCPCKQTPEVCRLEFREDRISRSHSAACTGCTGPHPPRPLGCCCCLLSQPRVSNRVNFARH